MAIYIATYDLKERSPDPHEPFLKEAVKHGWQLWILSDQNVWYRLPNTTLSGDFQNMAAAEKALMDTRAATASAMGRPVTMEKWLLIESLTTRFNSDITQKKT